MGILRTSLRAALLPLAVLVFAAPALAAPARAVRATNRCDAATASRIVVATNHYRASLGLQPLRPAPQLVRFAAAHARDMASHDILTHASSGGLSFAERARDSDYRFSAMLENVALEGAPLPNQLGTNLLSLWRHSAPHDANLRAPRVSQIGVAVARGPHGCYASMDLGQPSV
jgi:uncharacterized protein YkwD